VGGGGVGVGVGGWGSCMLYGCLGGGGVGGSGAGTTCGLIKSPPQLTTPPPHQLHKIPSTKSDTKEWCVCGRVFGFGRLMRDGWLAGHYTTTQPVPQQHQRQTTRNTPVDNRHPTSPHPNTPPTFFVASMRLNASFFSNDPAAIMRPKKMEVPMKLPIHDMTHTLWGGGGFGFGWLGLVGWVRLRG
jgi:hypothetical protein